MCFNTSYLLNFVVKMGLYNALWSTILTHVGWIMPMNMMIVVSGFKSIPDSLEEAGIIDDAMSGGFFARF